MNVKHESTAERERTIVADKCVGSVKNDACCGTLDPSNMFLVQIYKVEYDFRRRTALEIDLNEGELVTVLAKQDEAGNTEWWLVENDAGLQGYGPAAYLSQLVADSHEASPQLFC